MGRRSGHAGFELRTAVDIQRIGWPRRLPKDGFAARQLIEMERSLDLFKQLQAILMPVQQLTDVRESTALSGGSEAYMAALSYYNTVKLAAKTGCPARKPSMRSSKAVLSRAARWFPWHLLRLKPTRPANKRLS
ncbi:MAG: hypothetical protein JWL90_3181 [Chthoniobacteraceae bacterium]|nr:hypothetical protein [Chthoniobacteraceae bacterium]